MKTLKEMADSLPVKKLPSVGKMYSDVEQTEVEWLWENRLPLGMLILVNGMPGVRKTFWLADVISRVTTGRNWPDDSPCPRGGAVLITPEDDQGSTLVTRLIDAGTDLDRCIDATMVERSKPEVGMTLETPFKLPQDIGYLDQCIKRVNASVVCIDPIASASSVPITHMAIGDKVLTPLAQLAKRRGCTIIMINHMRKGFKKVNFESSDVAGFIQGAPPVLGIPRLAYFFSKDGDHGEYTIVTEVKRNVGVEQAPIAFSVLNDLNGRAYVHYVSSTNESLVDRARGTVQESTREQIIGLLVREDIPLSPQAISQMLDLNHNTVKGTLRRMLLVGEVIQDGYGEYSLNIEHFTPATEREILPVEELQKDDVTLCNSASEEPIEPNEIPELQSYTSHAEQTAVLVTVLP